MASGESDPRSFEIPIRFDAGMNLFKTTLLPRRIESWGTVPLEFIQHFDSRIAHTVLLPERLHALSSDSPLGGIRSSRSDPEVTIRSMG